MSEKKRILKTTGLLGLITLGSRVSGMARDIIIAAKLGASLASDVFLIAFELSNLARRVLGEGALSSFVVPLFTERRKKSEADGWKFCNRALNSVGLLTLFLTLLGMAFSEEVFHLWGGIGLHARAMKNAGEFMRCFEEGGLMLWGGVGVVAHRRMSGAASFDELARGIEQGGLLTRLMFPNLWAVAIGSVMMGVCNALGSFRAPAAGSIILNAAMILAGAAALWLKADLYTTTVWLAWGVLAGSALRVAIMAPPMMRAGWRWRIEGREEGSGLRELYAMMGGGLLGMSANQINLSLASIFAAYLGSGNKTFLANANRLIQFPMALTATALATAMLPQLAKFALEERHDDMRKAMGFAKRVEIVLMTPAMFGLMFFGRPIVQLIFQRGAFDDRATDGTAQALLFYSAALLPFGWTRLMAPYFYARKDVATPVRAAIVGIVVNISLSAFFTFVYPFGVAGLSLASGVAAFADYGFMSWRASRDPSNPMEGSRWIESLLKCAAASLVAVGAAWLGYHYAGLAWAGSALGRALPLSGTPGRAALLLPFLAMAAVLYFPLGHLFRVPDFDQATERLLRRFRRKKGAVAP